MSDIIHLLPDSVANQIAAGEVIQRPASVVKELMENALDAHATNLQVRITDAGRTAIQVIDNGCGMSPTDARLAFERHATSKIRKADDLFALNTMGFRGEALPSIAAVAQVELKTRPESEELGTQLNIAASQVEEQQSVACPAGSNFTVKNLFFNVPARRKFLKSNQTELSNIMTEFERIALAHPQVALSLTHNGTDLLVLPAAAPKQRILNVFGKKIAQQLYDLKVETTLVTINGFIGSPQSARKKGSHTYFYVNGRYMRHPYFHRAVMDAYSRLIPEGDCISYFLYLEVDPSRIDVNIHPTKTEIKFEDEQAVWQILSAAVRETLGRFNATPSIDFDVEGMPQIPLYTGDQLPQQPTVSVNPDFNPFKQSGGAPAASYRRPPTEWEKLYTPSAQSQHPTQDFVPLLDDDPSLAPAPAQADPAPQPGDATLRCYQYKGRYIVSAVKSGLMLIDQQRAHIRILYEKYMRQLSERHAPSQGMLFPEVLQLPISESLLLDEVFDDIAALGFDLSNLGNGSYAIQGVPAGIEGLRAADLLQTVLHSVAEKGQAGLRGDQLYGDMALSMARSVAIVPGLVLDNDEMNNLIDQLFTCSMPAVTPDGKPVLHIVSDIEIERSFK